MNWIKFIVWLLGIYTFYYTFVILWDLLRTKHVRSPDDKPELLIVPDDEPVQSVMDEPPGVRTESSVVSSGGVSLKELFNLARDESVEYIKAVSF